ncbi:NUDIX domain-containing protein [Natrinema halophilum]|uniref:NUDIX domain-containing protein n=1 Tax=Natrinema halophilum TaxID=1699371 RepID=A0A7D5GK34_9EURY|nr:NUDIX domain-containing protein [Natrinema halophilum]QLG48910.1 NUDIX domain-containing protein [Natrinema halophilum]
MEIHDEYVPDNTFCTFLETMPQVCVEVVVSTDQGILLVKRAIEPAKGEWFWPGSRLYKGESLREAGHRVAREELQLEIDIIEQLGVHEHFWDTSDATGAPSRHTVNIVFLVRPQYPNKEIDLDDQHSDARFVTEATDSYHDYVREYFDRHSLPR